MVSQAGKNQMRGQLEVEGAIVTYLCVALWNSYPPDVTFAMMRPHVITVSSFFLSQSSQRDLAGAKNRQMMIAVDIGILKAKQVQHNALLIHYSPFVKIFQVLRFSQICAK